MPSIVIIDDEHVLGRQIGRALETSGHEVQLAETGKDGIALVQDTDPDLVLLDLRLPDTSGLDVLEELRKRDPSLPVVLMTAYGSVSDAVEAMRRGAVDYLQKPLDLGELRLLVTRVLDRQRQERELTYLRDRDRVAEGVVGSDQSLVALFEQIDRLREADLPAGKRPVILLTGETGTGKGVLARAIHERLGGGPFIEANCTAMPESLIEAELFGHERGSFTDAKTARTGLFEAAEGGSLFLDEVGHATLSLQAKLLKVIEEKRVRRLGSSRERSVNVHVIAATNRDLDTAVAEQTFRGDLLHRLRVLTFTIPPLRERPDDIAPLARHFCATIGHTYGREVTIAEEGLDRMQRYAWPGNVRELRNVIERALLLESGSEIAAATLRTLLHARADEPETSETNGGFALPEEGVDLAALECNLIQQALERTGGNRTRSAGLLGLTRDTLRYRLEKYELS
ncbi:MAG: sigma-54-dependent Fis family transcriptional regulator [Deltaproteobacteria bacterium]|nr:sigma-54-dependent Fis family transcriptional regulator [Deltaproteobacteria bacterium]